MNENELVLTSVLNCPRSELYTSNLPLSDKQLRRIVDIKRLRLEGLPLQYLLLETEFYGLKFKVDNRVLIPRPETEILVEQTIRYGCQLADAGCHNKKIEILDIGTGSGCIAISLAKNLKYAYITASDISQDALTVARENATLNGVYEKIFFIKCDLFPSQLGNKVYDMIVSNPPYIASGEINKLEKEVREEPTRALDGGADGLNFYRRIVDKAGRFLKKEGLLLIEIGFGQCENIKNIFGNCNNFEIIDIVKDYNNIDRVVISRLIN